MLFQVDRQHQVSPQLAGQLAPVGQMGVGAFGNPQAMMEGSILIHNITRIVQVICIDLNMQLMP